MPRSSARALASSGVMPPVMLGAAVAVIRPSSQSPMTTAAVSSVAIMSTAEGFHDASCCELGAHRHATRSMNVRPAANTSNRVSISASSRSRALAAACALTDRLGRVAGAGSMNWAALIMPNGISSSQSACHEVPEV